MKLNAEQVKKALERDIRISMALNYECPRITYSKLRDSLALINSQEQRIKELTKDVERVAKQCGEIIVECDERDAERLKQVAKLTEENERLRAIPEQLHKEMSERIVEERKIERKLAVRKMQERLDKHFCHDPAFLGVEQRLIMDVIDQIAKEMLEGDDAGR